MQRSGVWVRRGEDRSRINGMFGGARAAVARCGTLVCLVVLCACGPLDPYWPSSVDPPTITAIEPAVIRDLSGGQILTIIGTGLDSATTVVIGDRNAMITERSEGSVTVVMPERTGGDPALDVAVVTETGLARLRGGLSHERPGAEWWKDERASVSITTTECPIEAWAYWDGDQDYYPLFWCGMEMGWSSAWGAFGKEGQAGFAGDMSGYLPWSLAPPPGEVRYRDGSMPPAPRLPDRYAVTGLGAEYWVQTARDFERDMARIDTQLQRIADYYSYWDDVVDLYPVVALYDGEACYAADAGVDDFDAGTLTLDADPGQAASLWLGVGVEEDFNGEPFYSEGFLSTAFISADGRRVTGEATGPTLFYDDFSGIFVGDGAAGLLGVGDVPPGARYEVSRVTDEQEVLGRVDGPEPFVVTDPDLLSGLTQIVKSVDFSVSWQPLSERPAPDLVAAELIVYDYGIAHPTGVQEVARLTTSAAGSSGTLTLPAADLARLPDAPNAIDDDDELTGLWGELNVTAHQLRRVPFGDGHLVVDFAHAYSIPIDLIP